VEDVSESAPEYPPEYPLVQDISSGPGENTDGGIFADPMAANTAAEPVDGDSTVNFFSNMADADSAGDETEVLELAASRNVFADAGLGARLEDDELRNSASGPGQDEGEDEESERGEALFGRSEDQPEIEEADEGYTAAGLAKAANAETVPELMVSAAAWMVLIQGQTTFTRHDVIDVFESIPGEHSKTLEARIKGFGKAVRNGHLIMIEDGVFGLSRAELDRFQSLL
jgi:hypothetical protein